MSIRQRIRMSDTRDTVPVRAFDKDWWQAEWPMQIDVVASIPKD